MKYKLSYLMSEFIPRWLVAKENTSKLLVDSIRFPSKTRKYKRQCSSHKQENQRTTITFTSTSLIVETAGFCGMQYEIVIRNNKYFINVTAFNTEKNWILPRQVVLPSDWNLSQLILQHFWNLTLAKFTFVQRKLCNNIHLYHLYRNEQTRLTNWINKAIFLMEIIQAWCVHRSVGNATTQRVSNMRCYIGGATTRDYKDLTITMNTKENWNSVYRFSISDFVVLDIYCIQCLLRKWER